MTEIPDLERTIRDVTTILSRQGIRFHLTGGLASSFYGEPRFTQDIDIVIRISVGSSLDQLVMELSQKFVVDNAAIEDAVQRNGLFQALHEETMIKVDFHVGEAVEGELGRSQIQEIFRDIAVPIVSKEDAILSKLIWIKKGSHKSRQDVKMMLKRNGQIDTEYLNHQAFKLGIEKILDELREELNSEN